MQRWPAMWVEGDGHHSGLAHSVRCPCKAAFEAIPLPGELRHVRGRRAFRISVGGTLNWGHGRQIGHLPLTSPSDQGGCVGFLVAHQRIDPAGLGAAFGSLENAALVGIGVLTTSGARRYF